METKYRFLVVFLVVLMVLVGLAFYFIYQGMNTININRDDPLLAGSQSDRVVVGDGAMRKDGPNDSGKDPAAMADLPGMPEGYTLTEEQLAQKGNILSGGAISDMNRMVPGVDYMENQFIFEAANEQEAETIAKAYGGELLQYGYGIGTAELTDAQKYTLKDLLIASADTTNNLPPISVNHIKKFN